MAAALLIVAAGVIEAEPEPVPEVETEAVLEGDEDVCEALAQVTAVGKPVAPAIPQKFNASVAALTWSAGWHRSERQHAMESRNESFSQIHLMSISSQLPSFEPETKSDTQLVYEAHTLALSIPNLLCSWGQETN